MRAGDGVREYQEDKVLKKEKKKKKMSFPKFSPFKLLSSLKTGDGFCFAPLPA
jgi:hypothetical protein